ncbi:hypothetical protein PAEVO_03990 [Paenibacillus sp. GM2FR]|uniref:hypothetical protein n=1 Tax=Paenibacillus sp. GM2FR TaxID=2059268 RepID=UPI000C272428|nr:hypothetical protein [Paenibacillus sp. GM2FR]PJN53678.1 hypothetical protein PAEVO_03990 [Paenibacillus sp. GM2FR]
MLKEWLSIAEETKLEETVDLCESHTEDIYTELVEYLNEIKREYPELTNVTDRIENLFILKTRRDVNFVFPAAIQNGIRIGKCLR